MNEVHKELYTEQVQKICQDLGINASLFQAIIEVESSWNPSATRYESSYVEYCNPVKFAKLNSTTESTERMLQKFSFGLAQLMGGVARKVGYEGPLVALTVPDCGLFWSAVLLKKICTQYVVLDDQISVYNWGHIAKANGKYENQIYVDRVKAVLKRDAI